MTGRAPFIVIFDEPGDVTPEQFSEILAEIFGESIAQIRPDAPNACPFCGSGETILTHKHLDAAPTSHFVRCLKCWAEGSHMLEGAIDDPKREALSAWNAVPGYAE